MHFMRRYMDVLCETSNPLERYVALGIDPETAGKYLAAHIPPARVAAYQRAAQKYNLTTSFDEIMQNERDHKRRQREDRDYKKLVAALPQLAAALTPLTHDQACAVIANDDDLFDTVGMSTSNPDWFEDNPEQTARVRVVMNRIKPFRHSPLYRGECGYRFGEHKRGFHSWSLNRQTAEYFYRDCGRDMGKLLMLTVPIKAIDIGHVGTWRMRLRRGESHYLGSQSEWLVPDGYPYKIIAER
jgi:hypothetical protein